MIASTGNTQGIRFRIKPPTKASSKANAKPALDELSAFALLAPNPAMIEEVADAASPSDCGAGSSLSRAFRAGGLPPDELGMVPAAPVPTAAAPPGSGRSKSLVCGG